MFRFWIIEAALLVFGNLLMFANRPGEAITCFVGGLVLLALFGLEEKKNAR